ncbi:winged helix DNA-binding protein [Novosphingobium sp. ZN18A2]|uniref:winged helix DNA-binding protein n=1 Tax=Novosphingobium sp. ZN18A2 TaxID=3079861 RepID=UPI0030D37153
MVGPGTSFQHWDGQQFGRQRAVGLFASDEFSLQLLTRISSDVGVDLKMSCSIEDLAAAPGLLDELDHITIAFDRVDTVAEAAAEVMKQAMAVRPALRALVLVPMELLELAWRAFDPSQANVLVNPFGSEIAQALIRCAGPQPSDQVRDDSETSDDLVRSLMKEVTRLSHRLDRLMQGGQQSGGLLFAQPDDDATQGGVSDRKQGYKAESEREGGTIRRLRPALPDPRLVRRVIRQRQLRARFLDADLFADPAWDILLDLTAARGEHTRVSVTSLCIASGVPPTTALRWIGQMTEGGLLQRVDDEADRRRAFIDLTDKAADAMARYFAEVGTGVQGGV